MSASRFDNVPFVNNRLSVAFDLKKIEIREATVLAGAGASAAIELSAADERRVANVRTSNFSMIQYVCC